MPHATRLTAHQRIDAVICARALPQNRKAHQRQSTIMSDSLLSAAARRRYLLGCASASVAAFTASIFSTPALAQIFSTERQKNAYNLFLLVEGGDQLALDRLRTGAMGGDMWQALQFGYINQLGIGGVPVSNAIALSSYLLAAPGNDTARNGLSLCAYNLGLIYLWGLHEDTSQGKTSPDVTQAIKWLRVAGLAMVDPYSKLPAAMQLAVIYENGFGRQPTNIEESVKWYRVAASAGDPLAMLKVGLAALYGRGAGLNIHEGIAALKRASNNGLPEADYELARLYAFGTVGVIPEKTEAFFWAAVAAQRDKKYLEAAATAKANLGADAKGIERAMATRVRDHVRRYPRRYIRMKYNVPLNQPAMSFA